MLEVFNKIFKPELRAAQVKPIAKIFGGIPYFNKSNTLANENTSLTLSAFYNAIDILSDDIAKLPKFLYKIEDGKKQQITDNYLHFLINVRPNNKMVAFTFWKTIEILRLLKGNAFVYIQRNQNTGFITDYVILKNEDVTVYEDENQLWYKYKNQFIASADILHFKGFSDDGLVGVGVVTYAAKSLGVSLDVQNFGQTVYQNKGVSYGVLETDLEVDPKNKDIIETKFKSKMASNDTHNIALLDEGFKYKKISITPAEAQFLETHQNGVKEVCRWLNIAPHLLKDLQNANYSNIYQQSTEHVQLSVMPRVIAKEQELALKTLTADQAKNYYYKFNLNALLRGDLEAKSKYYTSMVYAGILVRNEIRAEEDLNAIEGLDEPLQPVNMQALSVAQQILKDQKNEK
jgi:HK97 family phage portal protein